MTRIVVDARKIADFGIGTYLRGLVGGLAVLDRETEYVLLGDPADAALLPGLPANFGWFEERAHGYSLRELWSVSRAVAALHADLYHAPHYVLPFRLSCPAVVTIHDLIHLRFPEHRTAVHHFYARRMVQRSLRRAAAVLTVSQATRTELGEVFGELAARVEVIPNGIDERYLGDEPAEGVEAGLTQLGLDPGYFLFVGNPKPHKNLARLLEAHAGLVERHPAAPFLVVAGGATRRDAALPADLRRRAEVLTAGRASHGRVAYLGRIDDEHLPALYRGALALVVPSLWEGFGLPALEAMAQGVPVVAADRGGLPEVVGDAALLVDPESPESLRRAMARLLDEPDLRGELARRGRERARGFRWEETARRTLAVYRRVIPGRREAAPSSSPVGLVHDWLTGQRGGENVLLAIARLFPEAPIHTLFHFPGTVDPELERHRIEPSFLQRAPGIDPHYRWLLPIFPWAVDDLDVRAYRLVVSTSHCVAKSVRKGPGAWHICYCHTPMRYAWDQEAAYFGPGRGPLASLRRAVLARLRHWDAATANRVDCYVANSTFVADRIARYYRRRAEVVPPPVDTEFFTPGAPERPREHVLMVASLSPYKKVDVAIAACAAAGVPLLVVGEGPERGRLEALAGEGARLIGRVDRERLRDLYRGAICFLQPGIEDFGIAAVEALAAGTPVVARGAGGVLDIVRPPDHGVFFERDEPAEIAAAIDHCRLIQFNSMDLRSRADSFPQSTFVAGSWSS